MLYAILCYHNEAEVGSWPKEKDDEVLAKRRVIKDKLHVQNRLGPVARLMPTTAATTVRGRDTVVLDGPFAETKEQLLGFYVVDCEKLEDAIEVARGFVRESGGAMEIRPVRLFEAGSAK
ncbi:MAG: YciI family protein [Steroidobacteraceae bacterium]